MTVTVAGVFADPAAAQIAIERLRAAGVPAADISMVVRETERVTKQGTDVADPAVIGPSGAATGMATGGLLGALGGLLVGLGALAIPGVGPVLAAGPLAAALGGAALGAATGGLIGIIVDLGVPQDYATVYVTEIERGRVLVTVRADPSMEATVRDIMAQAGATNIYPGVTAVV